MHAVPGTVAASRHGRRERDSKEVPAISNSAGSRDVMMSSS